jgi:hypothetical protein
MEWLAFIAAGLLTGFLSGLLGIGGGIIMVPTLAMIFAHMNFPLAKVMHFAAATSLINTVATSTSAAYSHQKNGFVRWHIVKRLAPSVVIGTVLGAALADKLPTFWLEVLFGIFTLTLAVDMLWVRPIPPHRTLPGPIGLNTAGGLFGIKSGLLGVGGGILIVPFLVRCNVMIKNAAASSAVLTLLVAIAGSVTFMILGQQSHITIPWTTGYVYWPACFMIVPCSMITAQLGTRTGHKMDPKKLRLVAGIVLVVIGVKMFISLL